MNIMRDNEVTTEDSTLAEKTFGPDIGRLKGKTEQSRQFPVQIHVVVIPRELLSLHEEMETSLDGCFVNGQLFITSISCEMHHSMAISKDCVDKKNL